MRWIEALLALSLASCDRGVEPSLLSRPVAEAALRPGRLGVPSAAVEAVADARCARAQRCNDIGPRLEYASLNDCMLSTRAEWSEELNRIDGQRGVNEHASNACLLELSEDGCSDEQARGTCRPFELCDRMPQPPPVPLARDLAVPG